MPLVTVFSVAIFCCGVAGCCVRAVRTGNLPISLCRLSEATLCSCKGILCSVTQGTSGVSKFPVVLTLVVVVSFGTYCMVAEACSKVVMGASVWFSGVRSVGGVRTGPSSIQCRISVIDEWCSSHVVVESAHASVICGS